MKKTMYLVLAVIFILTICNTVFAESSGSYPPIATDPSTGMPYDFGGQTVYIYDWFSSDWHDVDYENLSVIEQARYDYRTWLEATYNVRVVNTFRGDWMDNAQELINYSKNPEGLAVFIISPDFVRQVLSSGAARAWNYDLSDGRWDHTISNSLTLHQKTYGATKAGSQPKQVLYFNKTVLGEAGIDWDDIYDMQVNGTWTWEAFENVLARIQRDFDGDGIADVYGLTGNRDIFYTSAVYSGGGSFFVQDEEGAVSQNISSEETSGALKWAGSIWESYSAPRPENSSWDWYKQCWQEGNTGFYIGNAYEGFNGNNSEFLAIEWGCVAFPTKEANGNYVTSSNSNVAMIPSCYDDTTAARLAFIYDVWTNPTPGFEDTEWIGSMYALADDRAIEETYAMLREAEHKADDSYWLLGDMNSVLGSSLLWQLTSENVDDVIENGLSDWNELCDEFNRLNICEHVFGDAEDYDSQSHILTCLNCGQVVYQIHTYQDLYVFNDENSHYQECADCGHKKYAEHRKSCSGEQTCIFCGAENVVFSDDVAHQYAEEWEYDENSHYQACAVCGERRNTGSHFVYCDGDRQTCAVCGYQSAAAEMEVRHTGSRLIRYNSDSHWHICSDCSELLDEAEAHKMSRWHYADSQQHFRKCEICRYKETEDHIINDETSVCEKCNAKIHTEVEYPDVIEGLDFGGREVFIYDWWSDGERSPEPTEEEQRQYDYWDWLQETYNVKVTRIALSDYYGNEEELRKIVNNADDSKLCIIAIPGGSAGDALQNNLYMPWTYGLDQAVFNDTTVDFMTKDGICYGTSWGTNAEPRQGVFFNKRILAEAGIDWNELYDLQADGTWTWDVMEEYMNLVQRDMDGDGTIDVWALTGNGDDVTLALVASNEADFYKYGNDGKLIPGIKDQEFLDAIQCRQDWGARYIRPNEQWDDYKKFWKEGNVAFVIAQAYEGFNESSMINAGNDAWGFVAVPKGPDADRYVTTVDNNIFGVPNVYDDETALMLEQLFTEWTRPVTGISAENAWAAGFYDLTDDRAVDETYAMLRQEENGTFMKYNLVGDRNSSITEITWNLNGGTPEEITDYAELNFKIRCEVFNGDMTQEEAEGLIYGDALYSGACGENVYWDLYNNGWLIIRGSGAMYNYDSEEPASWFSYRDSIREVIIENGVTGIGDYAFYRHTGLTTVTMASTVTYIGESAFARCSALTDVYFSGGLADIGSTAFRQCQALSSVTLPGSLQSIGYMAFTSCNLSGIDVYAAGSTEIWDFFYPWNYTEYYMYHIALPASVTEVGYGAFCDNPLPHDAPDFIVPEGLTSVEAEAFRGIGASFVLLSDSVASIGDYAFADCSGLQYIFIPWGCESIGEYAFPAGTTILGIDTRYYDPTYDPSYAETYANTYGYPFIPLENPFSGNG